MKQSAILGAAAWAALAVLARVGIARIGSIELLFLFAVLVVVPLALELGAAIAGSGPVHRLARRVQPVGAAFGVASLWIGPGRSAALLACGWLAVCFLVAANGLHRIFGAFRSADGTPSSIPIILALAELDLAVAGLWFLASRLGLRPMGIQEPIGLLTAIHFHFAGFATATIAASTLAFAQRTGEKPWLLILVLVVALMPIVVAAGFVIAPLVKMLAATIFSASVAALAIVLRSYGSRAHDRAARILLQLAAATIFAGMVLSSIYAVVDYLGTDGLTIPQMARTHGILNAVGFCLFGTLGWLIEYDLLAANARAEIAETIDNRT